MMVLTGLKKYIAYSGSRHREIALVVAPERDNVSVVMIVHHPSTSNVIPESNLTNQ